MASAGGSPTLPAWAHNLRAHPEITLEVGAETFPAHAVETFGPDRDRAFELMTSSFPIRRLSGVGGAPDPALSTSPPLRRRHSEVACGGAQFKDRFVDRPSPVTGQAGDAELNLGERNSSLLDPPAAGRCEHGERRTPVGRVRFAGDEAVGFEPVDGVGDRGRMHLESVADLPQRQLALLGERQQGEHLEPAEVEADGACGVDPPDRIWCARVMEVAAVIASTAAQPAPRQLAAASSIGSKSSVIVQ